MKTNPNPHPEDSEKQLTAILGAQIRTTSPDFDRRFEELRRRLATEEPETFWLRWRKRIGIPETGGLRIAALVAATVAIAAVVALIRAPYKSPGNFTNENFLELAALEESLSSALPLTDPETLDAILHMPIN
ncbi:MAG: hypothetical protein KJT03_15345 [Verrucomicrobiae bacterium]|nr:hypothetical protein [Verrucomicrobiae bacterium]